MSNSTLPHTDRLQDTRTLVIGGSAGIGYAVASGALSHGSAVHISSSNPTNISTAISQLRTTYPSANLSGTASDLSDPTTIETSILTILEAAITSLGGPLDHIVFTAGERMKAADTPLSEIEATNAYNVAKVRYLGPLMIAKLLAQKPGTYLKNSKQSSFTFTSGVITKKPMKGYAGVVGTAGALEVLAPAMAVELAPVRVNVVLPGAVRTGLLESLPKELLDTMKRQSLVGAIGSPDEVAEAYLYAMRCAFVTGQEIVVDGGFTLV